ncbi:DUF6153 family protein [Microbacterium sp. NPDC096154]|uniref:DUF6153 family protein n=1 Tax=Microbacterium sp. NPDC096154 TaxID=3155549 RepID=UPI0033313F40
MSVMTLRRAMRPSATLARTFLFTAAAVMGVLIGLIGMHVLSSGSAHHAPVVMNESAHHGGEAAMVDVASVEAATTDPSAVESCAADCGGGMDAMAFMACVLALLAVSIILAIRPGRLVTIARAQSPPQATATLTEAPPVPPDLNVLSISRT